MVNVPLHMRFGMVSLRELVLSPFLGHRRQGSLQLKGQQVHLTAEMAQVTRMPANLAKPQLFSLFTSTLIGKDRTVPGFSNRAGVNNTQRRCLAVQQCYQPPHLPSELPSAKWTHHFQRDAS